MISPESPNNSKTSPHAPQAPLEVLSPAGSPEALLAAVRCGADAVYFGGGGFNARRNAHNFDSAALREAVSLCHAHNVKVHFTLNTLIRQEELTDALALAEEVCALGVDAMIVQDLGLARKLHEAAPTMPLHASTQLSCHTPAGVRELSALGFSRVVLAREMSREEIAACAGQGAELEIFVHGALCMCVSGQCELSAMLGGRSGNRGLCAQPCRLPFMPSRDGVVPGEEDTALSLRDVSLLEYVGELSKLGVCSLKIEGRMKRPEYVAAATACFAAARDRACGRTAQPIDEQLLQDLQSVFSRSGFTDGYYTGHRDAAMFGSRRKEDVIAAAPALKRLERLYDKEPACVPVKLELTMTAGQPLTLRAADEQGHNATAMGEYPQQAVNRPLDAERVQAQLSKTGGTPFAAEVQCHLQEGLTVPLSALNALRRQVLDELLTQRSELKPVPFRLPDAQAPVQPPEGADWLRAHGKPLLVARFADAGQMPESLQADMTVLPLDTPTHILQRVAEQEKLCVEIPRGLFAMEDKTAALLEAAAKAGAQAALCGNIGALPLARQAGLLPVGGFGLNICNAFALNTLAERGLTAALLSQELTFRQMRFAREASIPVGLLAYGRQPLMLMRNCPMKASAGCAACRGQGALTDRKGVVFPVRCSGGCTELLNSAPLYLADELPALPEMDFWLLHFTTETPDQAARVIEDYRSGGTPPSVFTRGLYKRGVD